MSRTSSRPSRSLSFSMIPFFRKVSCCIQGALTTATVRVPSRKLTGRALAAICRPTAASQTSQIRPSSRRFSAGLPRKMAAIRSATGAGRFIRPLFSATFAPFFVEPSADQLARKGRAEGQGDEHPAEARLDPEIDDERDGDMDVEVPAEGELPVILPQVTERHVDREGDKDEPQQGEKTVHGTNSMVLREFCQ